MNSAQRKFSRILANSSLLKSWKAAHENHRDDWQMAGMLSEKIKASLWLFLSDYGTGEYPPKKVNRQAFLESEKNQLKNITFETPAERHNRDMRKPFSYSITPRYLRIVASLLHGLQKRGVNPPAKILELGCGSGWLLEMLVQHGYAARGTTITPEDVAEGELRVEAFKAKKLQTDLKFHRIEMEAVHQIFGPEFDVAIFHEALHHAFDWREALASSTKCLKPGGWLLLVNEPGWTHTFLCYRSAQIFRTLEIGFRRRELKHELKKLGYKNIKIGQPPSAPGLKGMVTRFMPFALEDGSLQASSLLIYAQKS